MNKQKPTADDALDGGKKLAERPARLWKKWDPKKMPEYLKEELNLPGADLLVLDSQSSIPYGPDLGRLYLASFKTAKDLQSELVEIIEASEFESRSKKAIIKLIRDFGVAREAHGRASGQFELLVGDQYFNHETAKKSREKNPLFIAEQQRVRLIAEWTKDEEALGFKGTNKMRFKKWLSEKNIHLNLDFTEKTWRRSVAKARSA
jgi:hypothetical protein